MPTASTNAVVNMAHGRLGDIEYVIHEKPVLPDEQDAILPPKRENPRQVNPRQVKPVLGKPEQENPPN